MAYATPENFANFGLQSEAFKKVLGSTIEAHLQSSSDRADKWLSSLGGYTVPLSQWGEDLTRAVCEMTAYSLRSAKGFNPEGNDMVLKERAEAAEYEIQTMAVLNAPHLVDGA